MSTGQKYEGQANSKESFIFSAEPSSSAVVISEIHGPGRLVSFPSEHIPRVAIACYHLSRMFEGVGSRAVLFTRLVLVSTLPQIVESDKVAIPEHHEPCD